MDIVDIRSKFGKLFIKHKQHGKTVSTTILDHDYYFYSQLLEEKDLKIVKKYSTKVVKHSSNGKEYHKIYCQNDTLNKFDLEKGKLDNKTIIIKYLLGRNLRTYEGDFDPWKRWLVDSNHSICSDPTVTMFDIETDDSKDGIEIGRDQILSFAYHVNGKSNFITDKDEYKLLLKIKQLFDKSDILVGWNSTNFDIPYVISRFQHYGIQFWKSELVHFDLMEIFKKRYKYSDQEPITNFNLENISQLFLGKGKIKHKEKIKWLFDNAIDHLEEYNKEDVNLLHELDSKLGIMELIIGVCVESRTIPRNYYVSEVVDGYILQEAKKHGRILVSNMWKLENREGSSEKQKFEGAIVFDPILGLHQNVTVLDYNSMYPNVMITFNIGIDSYLGKEQPKDDDWIKTPNGCYFKKSFQSIVSIVCASLLKRRIDIKSRMKGFDKNSVEYKKLNNEQEIVKVVTNSIYGCIGSQYSRYHEHDCAEAVTLTSQYILKWSHKWFTLGGFTCVSGDSDSLFVAPTLKE